MASCWRVGGFGVDSLLQSFSAWELGSDFQDQGGHAALWGQDFAPELHQLQLLQQDSSEAGSSIN